MDDRTFITTAPDDDGLVTVHFGGEQPAQGYRIPTPAEVAAEQAGGRVHLTYSEPITVSHPTGWTSPPRCIEDRVMAEQLRDATNFLSGPDAAKRRTWTIAPCDGSANRCRGGR
ncbi:hypothetical protein [Lentzea albidocapillata]|uniref:Uncharacterized protein n=1 Tax=Lentzea albidocapillata TaxID=40571 RepID=A0A1W2FRJ0_9PSEU|nr:hypothetical protein [Lentzea albidocapillata]SMD24228.1 hypothetical protein SAMN05660733_07684 [Lentzea albidocapillata]